MKNEFVPYELSKVLKELGFEEDAIFFWFPNWDDKENFHLEYGKTYSGRDFHNIETNVKNGNFQLAIRAPLWQQAFRWFKDKHHILGVVDFDETEGKFYYFLNTMDGDELNYSKSYDTYSDAQLACMKKLIEIVLTEKSITND